MRNREKIGVDGDFYTSPDISSLYGRVLADQMEEMWVLSGCPSRWTLVEMGAGKGILARDILLHCAQKDTGFFQGLEYLIIEKSPSMVKKQKALFACPGFPGDRVRWLAGLEDLAEESVTGCIFSNELLDSFPVHRVIRTSGKYREIYLSCENGELREIYDYPSTSDLEEYLNTLQMEMPEGKVFEVNLAMFQWLKEIERIIKRGFLLTIDYGDKADILFSESRPEGSIRSYRKHQLVDNLYKCPGDQDITAHVNFSDLLRWGEAIGLTTVGYTSQMYFLLNLGILDYLNRPKETAGFNPVLLKETLAVKKLVMSEGMGTVFKVAVQSKGFNQKPVLTGFQGDFGCRG